MLKIITLHWNKKDTIKKLKDSLLPAVEGLDWEWFIKDNGSTDGSIQEMEGWGNDKIHVIDYKHNKDNYAKGMNVLFDECKSKSGDYILTLNNDISFGDADSIKNMISILENDPEIGQVGAKLNFSDQPDKLQHCGVLFHRSNGLPYHFRASQREEERDRKNRIFPAITGAISLTTSDVYSESRLDEKYQWAFEDIDQSMKIQNLLKKKVVMCGETKIFHEESSSLKVNPVNKMFMGHNSRTFLDKWKQYIDTTLNNKYASDPEFNLYENK